MANIFTLYPFRQTLKVILRNLIVANAVPAINAALTEYMTGRISATRTIPQLGDANVILGDIFALRPEDQLIITVEILAQQFWPMSNDKYGASFSSSIKVMVPQAGDSMPEDFALVGDIAIDNLGDVLLTASSNNIKAQDSDGTTWLLPSGSAFYNCHIPRIFGPVLKTNADNTLKWRQWEITHYAQTDFYLARPLTVS